MLSAVNYSLGERRIEGQFVSLIYAVWNDVELSIRVSNSGLPRPIHCRDKKIKIIEATGLPLGLFEEAEYDEFTIQAKPGDVFVFFSDGILDATNQAGDLFGRTQVEKIVSECSENSAESIVTSLFRAAADYAAGVDPFDDQTVVAIKVKGSPGKRK
jgi:sigma-B regulation protein RsbU (phosphoserine phosphatase)